MLLEYCNNEVKMPTLRVLYFYVNRSRARIQAVYLIDVLCQHDFIAGVRRIRLTNIN